MNVTNKHFQGIMLIHWQVILPIQTQEFKKYLINGKTLMPYF